jgi:hypothetical protein
MAPARYGHIVDARTPAQVAHQIRGDAEQIIAAVGVVLVCHGGAQEPVIRFLQEIVGEPRVARHAREVRPHRPRGPIVEHAERVLVHLERFLGFGRGADSLELGKRHVTHDSNAC